MYFDNFNFHCLQQNPKNRRSQLKNRRWLIVKRKHCILQLQKFVNKDGLFENPILKSGHIPDWSRHTAIFYIYSSLQNALILQRNNWEIECMTRQPVRLYFRTGKIFPYLGYRGMCCPQGYSFLAILVGNRVSIQYRVREFPPGFSSKSETCFWHNVLLSNLYFFSPLVADLIDHFLVNVIFLDIFSSVRRR